MIIERLNLKAYGRFTDRTISLSAGPRRFFLIVGANESGKSTSLRAIGDWLFGFPSSTKDDYVHLSTRLRVGGRLMNAKTGEVLDSLRRKGTKSTLYAADNSTVIADDSLEPFMRGMSRIAFGQQFGISHQQLVEGGQQVVSGDGDLGELLFSAGAGVGKLRKLKEQLERDTKALFGERANSNSRLTHAITELNQLQTKLRQASVPQIAYDNLQRERDETLKQFEQSREHLRQLQQRIKKLEAVQLALPLFAQRDQLDSELLSLADVLPLMPGFSEQRSQAEADLNHASVELRNRTQEIKSLEAAIADATVADELLEYQTEIAALYRDLGHYEGQQTLLGQQQTALKHCQEKIATLTRELQLDSDSLFTIDISSAHRRTLKDLAISHSGMVSKARESKNSVERLEAEHERVAAELAAARKPPVAAALSQTLRSLGKPQSLLASKESVESKLTAAKQRLALLCRQLPGFEGDLQQAISLKRPSEAELRAASERIESAQQELDRLKQEQKSVQRKSKALQQQIDTLTVGAGLADLSELDDWVARRNELLVEALRLSVAAQPAPVQSTVDLQTSVREVDRLFKLQLEHRDQVVKKTQLDEELQVLEHSQQQLDTELAKANALSDSAHAHWQNIWQTRGVQCSDPRSMREWLTQHQTLLDVWQEVQQLQMQRQEAEAAIYHARAELIAALQSVGDDWDASAADLVAIHARALQVDETLQAEVVAYQNRVNQVALLATQLIERKEERKSSDAELQDWECRWQRAIEDSVLHSQVTPQSIDDLLQAHDRLAAVRDEAIRLESSMSGIRDYLSQYVERVTRIAKHCQTQLSNEHRSVARENAVAAVNELNRKSQQAKAQKDVAFAKQQSLEEVQRLVVEYHSKIEIAEATLDRLCSEAGCEVRTELAEYERRAMAKSDLLSRLTALNDKLQAHASGQSIEPFREECEAVMTADIESLLSHLHEEVAATESAMNTAQQSLGRIKAELERIGSSCEAVDLRQDVQTLLARMRRDADQFAKLVIAHKLLDRAIKRYQDQNQKSVLGLASDFFSKLTGGRYETLKVDPENDRPTLLAVSEQGEVPIPQLSDGTADALYLSFRLASIELHLKDHDPFPLIVDDCLIQFDDARSVAALQLFAELSLRTQVIMFTHHEHLAQLAEQTLPESHYHLIRLEPTA